MKKNTCNTQKEDQAVDGDKCKVAIVGAILLIGLLPFISNISAEKTITVDIPVGETFFYELPQDAKKVIVSVSHHDYHDFKAYQPAMHFYKTNALSTQSSKKEEYERTYNYPVSYEILLKGETQVIRFFAPEEYYEGDSKIITDSITVQISYEGGRSNPFAPAYDPQGDIEYLIITNESFYPILNNYFKSWKISKDDKINDILIVNVSDITSNGSFCVNSSYGDATNDSSGNHWITDGKEVTSNYELFNDTQAQIRNYIRYCYDTYNTRYVLLAGNKDAVPVRMVASYAVGDCDNCQSWDNDTSHASDMYYSCLHNNMNNNTNTRWMENDCCGTAWDDIDWGYDLCVGRVLVGQNDHMFNWINKTKAYINGLNQGNYLDNHIVACKNNANQISNQTWLNLGGAFSADLQDEFPANMTFLNNQNITGTQWNSLDDYVNGDIPPYNGFHLILHEGHGGSLYSPYNPTNTHNELTPNFVYSEGCTNGDFGTDTGSNMEKWTRQNDSAFAGIANSAYGWFGASTYYVEEMMGQMFNSTTGNYTKVFCQAHNDAREIYGHDPDCVWGMIVKETNFIGDPALEYQWYRETANITISNPNPPNGGDIDFNPAGIITSVDISYDAPLEEQVLESYTINNDGNYTIGNMMQDSRHQAFFHPESDFIITNISLNLTYYNVQPQTGFIYLKIYNITFEEMAGWTDWAPNYSQGVYSQGVINISQVPTGRDNYSWYTVNMTSNVLEAGKYYILVFTCSRSFSGVYAIADKTQATYAHGHIVVHAEFGPWLGASSDKSFLFKMYGVEVNNTNILNLSFSSNSEGTWQEYGKSVIYKNGTYSVTNSNFTTINSIYYWNVSALFDGVWTNQSYYFTLENIHFDPSDDIINGTTINTTTPTFAWSKINDASEYWLQISTNSSFSTIIRNVTKINQYNYPAQYSENSTSVIFILPPAYSLPGPNQYYCRVRAYFKGR